MYIYCPIECTPKPSFVEVLELTRITYTYWRIECTTKPSFEQLFKHAIITYINWPIDCTLRFSFGRVFELVKITYVYWSIQCIPNLHLYLHVFLKPSCWGVWAIKNYLHFLGNWMHVKNLSCWLNVDYNVQDFKHNKRYILW
jgi:hypothetical protein